MQVSVDTKIENKKERVWAAITDIENSPKMISGIIALEVLERPANGFIGFKWKETREMFGKEASETMWITDAVENEYYCTRAESNGSVYTTKLSLAEIDNNTVLTMTFTGEAQTMLAKILAASMGFLIKSSLRKAMRKDLEDIKVFVETTG